MLFLIMRDIRTFSIVKVRFTTGYTSIDVVLPGIHNDEPFMTFHSDYALVFFLEALSCSPLLREGEQFSLLSYTPESDIPAGRGLYTKLNDRVRIDEEKGDLDLNYVLTTVRDRYHQISPHQW